MKKISTVIMGAALLSTVLYSSCKKDTPSTATSTTTDSDATAAQDEANASFVINDSKGIADGAAQTNASIERTFGTCGTITGDTSASTDTIDIHFTGLCISPDGRTRKGDIIVYWTRGKNYFDSGSSVTQTWKNYSVTSLLAGTIGVVGSTNFTNTGKDSLGDHSWNYTSNVTLNYSTGGSAKWSATRNNVLTKVNSVWYYVITGGATGTSKSGLQYSETITSPLYWTAFFINGGIAGGKFCDCIEAGSDQITRSGKTYPLILTYTSGVGNCNHTATASINGISFPIILP